eukprot:12907624-Prorocentrum_lima.AAC.1
MAVICLCSARLVKSGGARRLQCVVRCATASAGDCREIPFKSDVQQQFARMWQWRRLFAG